MKRKAGFVHPKTCKCFGVYDSSFGAYMWVSGKRDLVHDTPMRIIRERDFQKLLKLAKSAKQVKRGK